VRRRLFNLAAAVSLALAVAIGALWILSYQRSDRVFRSYPKGVVGCGVARRALVLWRGDIIEANVWNERDDFRFETYHRAMNWDDFKPGRILHVRLELAGFAYRSGPAYQAEWQQLRIPCWSIVTTLLILPGLRTKARFIQARAVMRATVGLCPT
jgi:hypothetical protein